MQLVEGQEYFELNGLVIKISVASGIKEFLLCFAGCGEQCVRPSGSLE